MESFFDQSRQDLLRWVVRPARAARAFHEVYREPRARFSNAVLSESLNLDLPPVARRLDSNDGTRRYLLRLSDGRTVESVWIPGGNRDTFCISSQIGCALGCTFCLTAQMGLTRDLSAGEIVSQVLVLRRDAPRRRFSIVLMGMGEPLANYDSVVKAIDILHDNHGLSVPPARITLSTAGLIPGIERLSGEPVFPNLSISLTGVTNAVRDQLMPINRKYPIDAIVDAVRGLPPSRQSRVMFECVMIKGVTDSGEDARELARQLRGLRVKVNLIPLNPAPSLPFEPAERDAILRYQGILVRNGFATFIRKNRGNDVGGACGQLNSESGASLLSRGDSEQLR
jgi:23S rRNA (adenine2503-C2)-methyltransferase